MSYNVSLLNVSKVKLPSIKKLYLLYSLSKDLNVLKNSENFFLNFYVCLFFSLSTTNNSFKSLFLSLLYFSKTFDVLYTSKINTRNLPFIRFTLFSSNLSSTVSLGGFDFFWKKWKNLKRPISDTTFNSFYLDSFKQKLTTYSKIGFIKVYNSYIILRSNTDIFNNISVVFTKFLLIVPRYSSSSVNKYLSVSNLNDFEFQFLRKNKVYNKGRYSRTRQNYRTGVYMCMYLSVVSIFGLYY